MMSGVMLKTAIYGVLRVGFDLLNAQLWWWGILLLVFFWGLLAYLVLPRLHRILTSIYVPDYFIGRTRTSDGLLGDQ